MPPWLGECRTQPRAADKSGWCYWGTAPPAAMTKGGLNTIQWISFPLFTTTKRASGPGAPFIVMIAVPVQSGLIV